MAKHARHSSSHAGHRVGKKSALRTLLPAAAGLGVLFIAYKAIAGENKPPITPPVNPPINPPIKPPGPPWPAGTPTARVSVTTGQTGMNTRTRPDVTASLVHHNDAHNGSRVGVFEIDIPEEGANRCASCTWWKIMTPGGSVGYSRAVGPNGEHNFTPDGALPEQPITPPLVVAAAGDEMPGDPMTGPSVGRARMRAAAYFGRRPVN